MVQTTSFSIANYCVPCGCLCRHCLLDSRHAATGVEYERAERLSARLIDRLFFENAYRFIFENLPSK
jgi:hypothetical protein